MSLLDKASLIVTPNAYKSGTLYSVIPSDGSGDMTFSRASTGTRVNSQGLVEVVPYNLFTYTEQFDNSYWTKSNASATANATTAPNGTLTADKLTISSGFGSFFVSSLPLEGYHTISCYLKKGSSAKLYIDTNGTSGNLGAGFNLDTASVVSTWGGATANIENVGNGWFRVSIYALFTGTTSYIAFGIQEPTVGLDAYIWGAQLNEGSLKDYFPIGSTRNNFPRLDYSNGSCPSLLLEPQRTNVWTNSEDFNAGTINSSLITYTANTTDTLSPGGTNTADKFEVTTSGGDAFRRFTRTIAIQSFSLSLYVKGNAGQKLQLFLARDSFAELKDINVTLSGEWERVVLSDSFSTTSSTVVMGVEFGFSSNDSVAGQIYYLWGAQLEAGSYATSYIPTTSTSVTRVADSCSKTGISSLIGQTEGTLFFDMNLFQLDQNCIAFRIDNVGDSGIHFYFDANQINAFVEVSGVTQASISTTAPSLGRHKLAIAYKANDIAFYVDGSLIGTDTSASIPLCNEVTINGLFNGALISAFDMNSAILFKERLSNAELAQLTTI